MKRRVTTDGKASQRRRRKSTNLKRRTAPAVRHSRSSDTDLRDQLEQSRRELKEALEQQTATSEVLKVISRSAFDLQPVFDAMAENAVKLCEAERAYIFRFDGKVLRAVASYNAGPENKEFVYRNPIAPGRHSVSARAALERRSVQVADVQADPAYSYTLRDVDLIRTTLAVPMLKGNELVGTITIYRLEVKPFTEKQVALVESFAAQAVIAIENTRLLNELRESLQQQTATADVLKVISSSPGELEPVFQAMLENATRLCEASYGAMWLCEGDGFRSAALYGALPAAWQRQWRTKASFRVHPDAPAFRAIKTRKPVHVVDLSQTAAYREGEPLVVSGVDVAGIRTMLTLPMFKDDEAIGAISIFRMEVRPFSDKQIGLVSNFAAQAVIAIENTRLLKELRQRTDDLSESLEQQTATSEVLKVISSSPGDLKPVFEAILENATRICEAKFANLLLYEGGDFRRVALYGAPPAWADNQNRQPIFRPSTTNPIARVVSTKQPVHIADMATERAYLEREPVVVSVVEAAGARTLLFAPMLKENTLAGTIAIYRQEVRPFTNKQITLVQNFAAQAVIAIENTRLLNELRESLDQQTATADVLKVISRSTFDLQAVFQTLIDSAARLCHADKANIVRLQDGKFRHVAVYGFPRDYLEYMQAHPLDVDRGSLGGRAVLDRRIVHIHDVMTDPEYTLHDAQKLGSFRTALGVPLMRGEVAIGVMFLTRSTVAPFTQQELDLVATFADQAVIAIENVRLFDELRESLQQQTATADVLKVISRSTFDLRTVLNTLTESAARLCTADKGVIFERDGDLYRLSANYGFSRDAERYASEHPLQPGRGSTTGRVVLEGRTIHIPDVLADSGYHATGYQKAFGFRTSLGVPLLREGTTIGVFVLTRDEVNPFTEKQIELVTTFADQAVIAIENARLFNEVQARTRDLAESLQQQTATADVLKAISRSAFDLKTVLDALVEAAARLCEADQGTIARERGGVYLRVATYGFPDDFTEYVRNLPVVPERGTATGRALLEGKVVHIPDVQEDSEYTFVEAQKLGGFRTILSVPMLREGTPIGVLTLTRHDVRPFTDKQIELVSTFADQAAIAIENVRLFESVEARTRELAKSLEDLRTAQDRLVQTEKLASLGQLTAGIAHEIKNPLNFVNNFSAISVELIDELREALAGATLDTKLRAQINEVADMLQGNLDKVVQHGKRADSIVKNMLLHSRQGSGERRPVDINAVVEESLNLAYHGARAEKQGFNITLERSLDPAAGEVDLFPQEITRVLLNLISNGFYAATKRKAEANGGNYEPTLAAATKNLGDRVEIRIRDNGTGIPPEVKAKMFNPFFTTKPVGEGTGLGLSLSYDIIVKQHGGSIEVETEPGEFTEFRIVLPRGAATLAKSGGRA